MTKQEKVKGVRFERGVNYLEKIRDLDEYFSEYKCLVCGFVKRIRKNYVENGHDKTCGCRNRNSHRIKIEIHKDGRITSQTGMILNSKMAKGYESVTVNGVCMYVHRMVADKYLKNPLNLSDVNHINGNKKDNRVENLEWCTRSSNIKHAIRTGLNSGSKGVVSKKRKLTEDDIRYIVNSEKPSRYLARELRVSKPTILNIRKGTIYKDVLGRIKLES